MPVFCAICGFSRSLPEDWTEWPKILGTSSDIYPITKGGKLDGEVKGFICARCLGEAKRMRTNLQMILKGVTVTKHAIDRFIERSKGHSVTPEAARSAILKLYAQARPIRFRDDHMLRRIFSNKFQSARYFYIHGWIMVATDEDPPTILTMEVSGQKKLGKDFFYVEESRLA